MPPVTSAHLRSEPAHDQETRKHLLWWLLIRVFLFTLLIGITSFLHGKGHAVILPPLPLILAFLLALYCLSIVSAFFLQQNRGSAQPFALAQLLFDSVCANALVYATGCSQSIFTPILILPIITGGLILYKTGGLIIAAASTLLYGIVLGSELSGFVPRYFFAGPYTVPAFLVGTNLFAIYGSIFFLVALLSGQLARRLRYTEEKLSKTALEFDRLSILYKQIFDDISTGIITTDHRDFITSYNQAAERITGYSRESVLGRPFEQCFPAIILQEGQERCVCDLQKNNGSLIRAGYSFSYLNMPGAEERTTRWKVITLQDISRIERMEQQVREAEKMAAIGELSASIAHDFRNPLAAISGSAQILALEQTDNAIVDMATFKPLLSIILRESNRMAKTITDFLQFARPETVQQQWFDVGVLVDEAIGKLSAGSSAMSAAHIVKRIDSRQLCWADRQQIGIVVTHLLENALVAVGTKEGLIVVAARMDTGQGVFCFEISDQGPGIPKDLKEKVFTPFFSSRADGTGLGLAIVRQIVENHQGKIELDNNETFGCIVRIVLPLPEQPLTH